MLNEMRYNNIAIWLLVGGLIILLAGIFALSTHFVPEFGPSRYTFDPVGQGYRYDPERYDGPRVPLMASIAILGLGALTATAGLILARTKAPGINRATWLVFGGLYLHLLQIVSAGPIPFSLGGIVGSVVSLIALLMIGSGNVEAFQQNRRRGWTFISAGRKAAMVLQAITVVIVTLAIGVSVVIILLLPSS